MGKSGRKQRNKEREDARENGEDDVQTEDASNKKEDSTPPCPCVPEGHAKIKGSFCGEIALSKQVFHFALPLDNLVPLEVLTELIGAFAEQAKEKEQQKEAERATKQKEEADKAQREADAAIKAPMEDGTTKQSRLSSLLPCCFTSSNSEPAKTEEKPEHGEDTDQEITTLSAEMWTSMHAIFQVESLNDNNQLLEACVELIARCETLEESKYDDLADVLNRRTVSFNHINSINRFSLFEAFHTFGAPTANIIKIAAAHKHVKCETNGDEFVQSVRKMRQDIQAGAAETLKCHDTAIHKSLQSNGKPSEEDTQAVFDMFDWDKDGAISKTEFWTGFVKLLPHVQEQSEMVIRALQFEFDVRGKTIKDQAHQLRRVKRENKEFKRRDDHAFFKELADMVGNSHLHERRLEDLEDYDADNDLGTKALKKAKADAKRKDAAEKKKKKQEQAEGGKAKKTRPGMQTSRLSSLLPGLFPPGPQSQTEDAEEQTTDVVPEEQEKEKWIEWEPIPEGKVLIDGTFMGIVASSEHRLEMMLPMDGYVPTGAWLDVAGGLADSALAFKAVYERKGAVAETMEKTWRDIATRHGSREIQEPPGDPRPAAEHHCIGTPTSPSLGSPVSRLSPWSPAPASRTEIDEDSSSGTARDQEPMSAARTMEKVNDEVDRLLEKLQAMQGAG